MVHIKTQKKIFTVEISTIYFVIIAVVKTIQESVMPPTINLDNPDDGFDLNFVANT